MYYRVTKLNKRNTWHQHFTHRVEVMRHYSDRQQFDRTANFMLLRQWCWDQYGPSVETYYWEQLKGVLPSDFNKNYNSHTLEEE